MEDYLLLYCQEKLNFTPNENWAGVQDICESIDYVKNEKPVVIGGYYRREVYSIFVGNVHIADKCYYADGGIEVEFTPFAITVFEPYIRQIFEACINLQK